MNRSKRGGSLHRQAHIACSSYYLTLPVLSVLNTILEGEASPSETFVIIYSSFGKIGIILHIL